MIDKFDGRYAFLSNFYPCEVYYKGIIYPSVEHYYVALKCNTDQMIDGKYYTCSDFRELIAKVKSPGKVKGIGRTIKVRSDWDNVKLGIMKWGVEQKFKNTELTDLLLSTGEQELIEGNWWHDRYWGVCNGTGENNLGKILMTVREELRKENKDKFFK
jgi:ribA/ribD-fused uncharacterized protein